MQFCPSGLYRKLSGGPPSNCPCNYNGSDELKQLVFNLQMFSQSLLYEIYTTNVQREAISVRSAASVPSIEASTRLRPRYRKEQIKTLQETWMNWKRIALSLGISESTLYCCKRELAFHKSFVERVHNRFGGMRDLAIFVVIFGI